MLSLGVAIRGTDLLAQSETCNASKVYWDSRLCGRLRTRSHGSNAMTCFSIPADKTAKENTHSLTHYDRIAERR